VRDQYLTAQNVSFRSAINAERTFKMIGEWVVLTNATVAFNSVHNNYVKFAYVIDQFLSALSVIFGFVITAE
jgi:hypothetical protein